MGGIFRAVDSRKGEVILGKGQGFAVEQNVRLADLQTAITREMERKQ
jgi:hypothetical protein